MSPEAAASKRIIYQKQGCYCIENRDDIMRVP